MREPIPAHVVTGPLGSGKTTVIASLLAGKPPEEDWVVLLNEFSDAGIDALTVASAARGAFDVRLVPGGCLCCAGEQDFRRNLQELVTTRRPRRIIVEPSGLGHPSGIVEELLAWESAGALRLTGIIALLDPVQLRDGGPPPGSDALAQVEIADALALSKADLADRRDRTRFATFVAGLFPPKIWVGEVAGGRLPREAFEPGLVADRRAAAVERPALHEAERHSHSRESIPAVDEVDAANGRRAQVFHVGHRALRWVFPRAQAFSRERLAGLLAAVGDDAGPLGKVARLKGVLRTSEDEWLLAQVSGHGFDLRPSSWRRDSRVEVLLDDPTGVIDERAWDAAWLRVQQR